MWCIRTLPNKHELVAAQEDLGVLGPAIQGRFPGSGGLLRVGLDDAGKIVGWDHRVAGQSIAKDGPFDAFYVKDGVDVSSVEGTAENPYAIPGMHIGLTDAAPATTVNYWRSVGHSHNAYVMETMMDVAALPKITERLLAEGYTEEDLADIWGNNVLRLLQQAKDYAQSLKE